MITLKATHIKETEKINTKKKVRIQKSKHLPWASGPGAALYTASEKKVHRPRYSGITKNKIHREKRHFNGVYINLGGGLNLGPAYLKTLAPNGV